ncbi:MAG: hypothetical protein WC627_07365 [Legionella sp.]|jgi:hypothetical protein
MKHLQFSRTIKSIFLSSVLFLINSPLFAENYQIPSQIPTKTTKDIPLHENKVKKQADGSSVEIKGDGTKIITHADGSSITKSPDGTELVKNVNGSSVLTKPDGTKLIVNQDGSSLEIYTDGTRKVTNNDGSSVQTNPDGSVTYLRGNQAPFK